MLDYISQSSKRSPRRRAWKTTAPLSVSEAGRSLPSCPRHSLRVACLAVWTPLRTSSASVCVCRCRLDLWPRCCGSTGGWYWLPARGEVSMWRLEAGCPAHCPAGNPPPQLFVLFCFFLWSGLRTRHSCGPSIRAAGRGDQAAWGANDWTWWGWGWEWEDRQWLFSGRRISWGWRGGAGQPWVGTQKLLMQLSPPPPRGSSRLGSGEDRGQAGLPD